MESKRCGITLVPSKPSFKEIDDLFILFCITAKHGLFKAIVVPTQITIVGGHSDSETAFVCTLPE